MDFIHHTSLRRCRSWTKTFLHFGYFLQKRIFLHKGCLSAEGLVYICQNYLFLQKAERFCRNKNAFCRKICLSAIYGFRAKPSAFGTFSFGFGHQHFGSSLYFCQKHNLEAIFRSLAIRRRSRILSYQGYFKVIYHYD